MSTLSLISTIVGILLPLSQIFYYIAKGRYYLRKTKKKKKKKKHYS
jgi:hypothetical protein